MSARANNVRLLNHGLGNAFVKEIKGLAKEHPEIAPLAARFEKFMRDATSYSS
jgi:hypothetical protein